MENGLTKEEFSRIRVIASLHLKSGHLVLCLLLPGLCLYASRKQGVSVAAWCVYTCLLPGIASCTPGKVSGQGPCISPLVGDFRAYLGVLISILFCFSREIEVLLK